MTLDIGAYLDTVSHYIQTWKTLDDCLYALCKNFPDHSQRDQVCAKLWIIGRTYATGIERGVRTTGMMGSSMSQVAEHLLSHRSTVDEIIQELRQTSEPLTPEGCRSIVSLHGRFIQLISLITKNGKTARSFASKYLHFHHPVVPIFDAIACAALRRVIRWSKRLNCFEMPVHGDDDYGWYVMRFLALYNELRSNGCTVSVRYVDNFLLHASGK